MFLVIKNKVNDKVLERLMNSQADIITNTCESLTGLEACYSAVRADEYLSMIDNFYTVIEDSTDPPTSVGTICCYKTSEVYKEDFLKTFNTDVEYVITDTGWEISQYALDKYTASSLQGLCDVMLRAIIADKTTNHILCVLRNKNVGIGTLIRNSLKKYNFELSNCTNSYGAEYYYRSPIYAIDGNFYS